jgi:DNA repair protein RadA/Sms
MILAVLDARAGLGLSGHDVYLNVAGGLKVGEPAADLAVAAALVSSAMDMPVPADMVVFGEIGLSGEVRAVSQAEARLKEAAKLGFARALVPKIGRAAKPGAEAAIAARPIGHVQDLSALFRRDAPAATTAKK